jgi:predicted oxidoreductase (fatty acid repression mutant protein)
MAPSTDAFLAPLETRRSLYDLSKSSPVSNQRIQEIATFTVKNLPSPFNVQSARVVILFGADHEKLWDFGAETVKSSFPEPMQAGFLDRVAGFRGAYGSVLFFEDQDALKALGEKNPSITGIIPEWSDHSSGMHQITVWAALENEGLGANLQHYNFSDSFNKSVREQWNIPEAWKLKAQLVFGKPLSGPSRERTYLPIEPRLKVYGA